MSPLSSHNDNKGEIQYVPRTQHTYDSIIVIVPSAIPLLTTQNRNMYLQLLFTITVPGNSTMSTISIIL